MNRIFEVTYFDRQEGKYETLVLCKKHLPEYGYEWRDATPEFNQCNQCQVDMEKTMRRWRKTGTQS